MIGVELFTILMYQFTAYCQEKLKFFESTTDVTVNNASGYAEIET